MTAVLSVLRPYLRPHRRRLGIAMAAMLGEIVTALFLPVPIQRAVDLLVRALRPAGKHALVPALSPSETLQLFALAGALLLIAVADAAVTYLDASNTARVAQQATTDLRRALFNHLQRLSMSFHHGQETRTGDLQLRLGSDVANLQTVVATVVGGLVTNGGTALVMLGALLLLNWQLGIVALAGSCPVYVVSRHFRRKVRQAVRAARKQEGEVSAMLAETLAAAKLVQVMGHEEQESDRVAGATEEGLAFGLEATEAQARFQPAVALVTSTVLALVLLIAALLVLKGRISVGQLTLAIAYARGMFSAMRQLAKLPIQTQRGAASAERLREMLSRAPEVSDPQFPRAFPTGRLDVRFERVTFGYQTGRPILEDFSWTVEAGSKVALVGPTGAGKSTALALVPRLYDVWSGSIRVGGVDVREIGVLDLRQHVMLILQETLLFRDTVWNNIAYGRPGASRDEVMAAVEAAGVLTFVDRLANGLDTMVSERGATLSGGQKQCVAVARAMIRDAPLVIMDEPTSSMDAITEHLVISGIRRLLAGRTAIVIAHRFSTIQDADVVAVMEAGRLVETGPPDRLLAQRGLFAELAHMQDLGGSETANPTFDPGGGGEVHVALAGGQPGGGRAMSLAAIRGLNRVTATGWPGSASGRSTSEAAAGTPGGKWSHVLNGGWLAMPRFRRSSGGGDQQTRS
jgi:ATP-binding cassette subfamily B protein/subfamily B ATP-binding cassette protein MsbA